MSYSPAYMQPSLMEGQESTQLYSSAMQLTSYANNIMGHTMNQYAAQTSLLSSQVTLELSAIECSSLQYRLQYSSLD